MTVDHVLPWSLELLLAGIVGRVRVRDAEGAFAADLNDCWYFGECIVVGIGREFDKAARTKRRIAGKAC